MALDVSKQLTKARARLIMDQPFFGALALRLTLVEKPVDWFLSQGYPPTMCVDGERIFFCPEFVACMTIGQTETVLAHEVCHCIFDHIQRGGVRDGKRWNHAIDYATNQVLADAKFEPGPGWLLDPAYAGMTAEQIYNLLPEKLGQDGFDSVMPGSSPMSEAERTMIENDWKIATIQAANAARASGKLPASLDRLVTGLTATKSDWRAMLRRFVTERSKNDYSWARPNRRYIAQGIVLPSLYDESMGEIVIAVDTSGSIDQTTLDLFGSEISAIRSAVRPRMTRVIYCDAAVNHEDEFTAEDELQLKMYGGGGTDFRPPFESLAKRGIEPACFIYLTDMYGTFPADAASFPTIWCAISDVIAPWGETIRIED